MDHSKVKKKIREGEEARRPFEPIWAECDDFDAGRQTIMRRYSGEIFNALDITNRDTTRRSRRTFNMVSSRAARELASYTALAQGVNVDPVPPVGSTIGEVAYQSATAAAVAGERQLAHFDVELDMNAHKAEVRRKCIIFGEGYLWPYYDSTKGRQIGASGKYEGRATLLTIDGSQIVWEQGQPYNKSLWAAVECFYTPEEIMARWPGKFESVSEIKANATGMATVSGAIMDRGHNAPNLVSVYEYLERPSPAAPAGAYMVLMGAKVLEESAYPYNYEETNDEQWIVRYFYMQPERRSRGKGFLEDLIDPQRAFNREKNLRMDWITWGANPMILASRSLTQDQILEFYPGKTYHKTPGFQGEIEFVAPANPPQALLMGPEDHRRDMDAISGQFDPTQLASSAASSTIQLIVDQDKARQGEIARGFDRADAKVATRLLILARENYTEPRTLSYRSKTGQTTLTDFVASKELPARITVRIKGNQPESRQQTQATATQWGVNQWASPSRVMLAVKNSDLNIITEPFELDIAKQQRENGVIYKLDPREIDPIIKGFSQIMASQIHEAQMAGATFDPTQASPPPGPWPHAGPDDNDDLHIQEISDWMKTQEYELSPPSIKQIAQWHKQEHVLQKTAKAQQEAQAQMQNAQQLGAMNAARPATIGQPSQPSLQSQALPSNQQAA